MSALILVLAKATAVLLAAYVAATSLRKSAAGMRHLVWVAALGAVIALPLLARFAPVRLEVLPARVIEQATAQLPATNVVQNSTSAIGVRHQLAREDRRQLVSDPNSRAGATVSPMLVAWAVVSAALVGWLVVGASSVRRILRASRDLTTPDWTTPLCEVADRLDLAEVPRLVASDRIEMAFACNPFRPTIVLPATSENWTDDRRRAVLLHELAHVRRRDLFGHTVGRIACALYWFHPLVWSAARRLRDESERACDDLVLTCGARPSEYAQHLLDMVTGVRRFGAPATALPMARKKEFEGRMLAILDPAIRRVAPGRMQSAMVVASLAVLSLSIAAVAPARSAPVTSAPGVTAAAPSVAPSPRPTPRTHTEVRQETQINRTEKTVTSIVQSSSTPLATLPVQATPQSVAGDTGKVAIFVRLLRTDSDAEIRKTAAWALSETRTETTLRALMDALKSDADAEVREMSAWALASRGEAVIKPLADALRGDKNAEVRETAAWALGQMNARDEMNTLVAAIGDANEEVRRTAIWAIGTIGTRTAPAGLVNGLKDSDQEVRVVTAWALGEIADPATATALITAFTNEKDDEAGSAELRAIALMGKDTQAVIEAAITSKNTEVRRQGIQMLAGKSGSWPWPWPWPRPRPSP